MRSQPQGHQAISAGPRVQSGVRGHQVLRGRRPLLFHPALEVSNLEPSSQTQAENPENDLKTAGQTFHNWRQKERPLEGAGAVSPIPSTATPGSGLHLSPPAGDPAPRRQGAGSDSPSKPAAPPTPPNLICRPDTAGVPPSCSPTSPLCRPLASTRTPPK